MPVIRVIKKSSSRNVLAQSKNHTFRKCKQFNIRNTKKRKMSRKYKILYGGEQHINTISNEMKIIKKEGKRRIYKKRKR
jgi:hypothetical protein